ncbi:uncharacterized protein LOC134195367 isoform X2 [Corticium candelabrum]|uniref:uncharacterized protein LOC134195367 isoform X2 n=1 Tax=Corticium candelabrum TaxID=121492 RepID=UPI002E25F6FB|nr:uncharacterized protein LOC134195367 isoform X2 [Corticium candelabrum]
MDVTSMDDYLREFVEVCRRVEDGREFTVHVMAFWERLAKLQLSYAKGLEELCHGKKAVIERIFKAKNRGDREHVGALRDLWSKVLSDIELMSTSQQEIGNHISKQIAQPIDSFVKRKLNKQAGLSSSAQIMLKKLRADNAVISEERSRYVRSVKADIERNKTVGQVTPVQEVAKADDSDDAQPDIKESDTDGLTSIPVGEGDKDVKGGLTSLESIHKQNVARFSEDHNRVFSVVLPGILEEVNMIERERIEMLCSCCNQFACKANELLSLLTFKETTDAIQAALETSRQDQLLIGSPIPDAPAFAPPTAEELRKDQGATDHASSSGWKGVFQKQKQEREPQSEDATKSKSWFSFRGRGRFSKKQGGETQPSKTDKEDQDAESEAHVDSMSKSLPEDSRFEVKQDFDDQHDDIPRETSEK